MFSSSRAASALVLGAAIALSVFGCGGSGDTLYPVSGKVTTAAGTELTVGAVTFIPDAAKNNKARTSPTGQLGAGGTYSLTTDGKPGAPAGHYKVTVVTNFPGAPKDAPRIDAKYATPMTTDIHVEVVPSPAPGAYDIKLRK